VVETEFADNRSLEIKLSQATEKRKRQNGPFIPNPLIMCSCRRCNGKRWKVSVPHLKRPLLFYNASQGLFNPLGSKVFLGSLRCCDMLSHLCFFQLLINILKE